VQEMPCQQSPFGGGLLSKHLPAADGVEGIADVLDLRRAAVVGPEDGHDVEAAALLEEVVLAEEVQRGECDSALLLPGDRLGRHAPAPRLDLDEDQGLTVARDQVDLAGPRAIAPQQDPQALAAKEPSGQPLATLAQEPIPERPHD